MSVAGKASIRYKLFISQISLILVAIISFFIISASYFIVKTKNDILTNMRYSSNIISSNVYNYISSMENCIYYTSYNTDIPGILAEKSQLSVFERHKNYVYVTQCFLMAQSNYKIPLQITLYPSNENLLVIDSQSTDRVSSIENKGWFKSLKEKPSKFFYFTETADDKRNFCIVNTLYNENNYNDIVGYLKISADISVFENVLKESSMANSSSMLLNSGGDIICSSDGKNYRHTNEFANLCDSKLATINVNGENFYGVKKGIDRAGYDVIVLQSTSVAYRTLYVMFSVLFVILLVISAASLAISYLASGSVIKSLDTLVHAMKKTKFGELKQIENYPSQNAEIVETISAYNHMITSINDLIAYNNDYSETLKKYEFNFLQMQIKPHFLYNTLDIIQYLAKENKTDDVTFLIKNLSRFYKISLHNKSDLVTLENEIKHISYYVAIENFKHDNAITLKIDIPDELMGVNIPKITLQPLVENAIGHGILENENPVGTITVSAEKSGDDVLIFITDDGVGIPQEKIDAILSGKTHSVGIMNTNRRLKLFFGSDYGLTIESKENEYTKITIKVKGAVSDDTSNDC